MFEPEITQRKIDAALQKISDASIEQWAVSALKYQGAEQALFGEKGQLCLSAGEILQQWNDHISARVNKASAPQKSAKRGDLNSPLSKDVGENYRVHVKRYLKHLSPDSISNGLTLALTETPVKSLAHFIEQDSVPATQLRTSLVTQFLRWGVESGAFSIDLKQFEILYPVKPSKVTFPLIEAGLESGGGSRQASTRTVLRQLFWYTAEQEFGITVDDYKSDTRELYFAEKDGEKRIATRLLGGRSLEDATSVLECIHQSSEAVQLFVAHLKTELKTSEKIKHPLSSLRTYFKVMERVGVALFSVSDIVNPFASYQRVVRGGIGSVPARGVTENSKEKASAERAKKGKKILCL